MKDGPDDIPMVYLLYVVLAIAVLVAGAAIVATGMLWHLRSVVHPWTAQNILVVGSKSMRIGRIELFLLLLAEAWVILGSRDNRSQLVRLRAPMFCSWSMRKWSLPLEGITAVFL
jgi:hypothetical protein